MGASATLKRRTVRLSISTSRSRAFRISSLPMASAPMAWAPMASAPRANAPTAGTLTGGNAIGSRSRAVWVLRPLGVAAEPARAPMRKASGRKDRLRFGLPFSTPSLGSIEMPAHHSGGLVMRLEVPGSGFPVSSRVFRLDSTSGQPLVIPCNIAELIRVSHGQAHAIAIGFDMEGDAGDLIRVLGILRKGPGQHEVPRRRDLDHVAHDVDQARIVEIFVPPRSPHLPVGGIAVVDPISTRERAFSKRLPYFFRGAFDVGDIDETRLTHRFPPMLVSTRSTPSIGAAHICRSTARRSR